MSVLSDEMNTAKHTLQEVANQAYGLAMGLQNAAPNQVAGGPSKSVQYLLEISLQVNKVSKIVEEMMLADSSKRKL